MLIAPSVIPQALVDRITADVRPLMRNEGLAKSYAVCGTIVKTGTSAELSRFLEREVSRFADLVRSTGMQADWLR